MRVNFERMSERQVEKRFLQISETRESTRWKLEAD